MKMGNGCFAGIDIGAVSVTAVVICPSGEQTNFDGWERTALPAGGVAWFSPYRRTKGKPVVAAQTMLDEIRMAICGQTLRNVVLTGSGAKTAAGRIDAATVNEFSAIAAGLSLLDIEARSVFEIGGETSKYLLLEREPASNEYSIIDYATNGDCAAGTGSFIDQQARRLRFEIESVGDICSRAARSAQIAGRCSVFAKSDMIHAQQKGYSPAEVLRGLCDAVARNFRMAVVRSHRIELPVVFIGGVTANSAVVNSMKQVFELGDGLVVPNHAVHIPAAGAAVTAMRAIGQIRDGQSSDPTEPEKFPTLDPLSLEKVILLRDCVKPFEHDGQGRIDAYMGIDIGSVSTNVVVLDENGQVVDEIYTRTQGRPIEVVAGALREIETQWSAKLNIRGVGTTGSGRELIGQLVGADTINDEITAHKTGAMFVGKTLLGGRVPDTIFEIGGQDSKFISLSDGIVVDFTMNEACAAGTGSFLEERADELEVAIKGEFARLALSSKTPIRLGERCTVFMERDVNSYMQHGAKREDLLAGLCYSVVQNYINRVVRGRKIGSTIFFQGGTAYNDATAAAFSMVTGKEIIVPPHNGVIGAIGSALLAQQKMADVQCGEPQTDYMRLMSEHGCVTASKFRGYDLERVDFTLREFTCRACNNNCSIQEFTVAGEKTYWGDKCSDRYRKHVKTDRQAVIDDVMCERNELLFDALHLPSPQEGAPKIGIPMTMFAWGQLPFWRTLLAELGFDVILGEQTNQRIIKAGLAAAVAEPCFPIIVAHGHMLNMAEKQVDYILAPSTLSVETRWTHTEAHLCPWHQTLSLVTRRAPELKQFDMMRKYVTPLVEFQLGRAASTRQLERYFTKHHTAKMLGITAKKLRAAANKAFAAQDAFVAACHARGEAALETLRRTKQPGILLAGRYYNVHDAGMNLAVARKLRDYYGVNVIPMDCVDLRDVDIRETNPNMYWALGREIIAAACFASQHDNLHIIHITNFKCGPDSYVKQYIAQASGKPYLSLQFDGHSNDAGMITRCEAYLDSKGII